MIVHRDLKPANLMLGGIPHETGTREMVRCFLVGSCSTASTPACFALHLVTSVSYGRPTSVGMLVS